MRPFFSVNPQVAMREISATLRKGETQMSEYAEDFSLYYIGEFNEARGTIQGLEHPDHLCRIADLSPKLGDP